MSIEQNMSKHTLQRQRKFDKTYMAMAKALSQLSYAIRAKVGCLIVSPEGQIVSQGYNGMPAGSDNDCERMVCTVEHIYGCTKTGAYSDEVLPLKHHCIDCKYLKMETREEVLHAESNAITKCAKWGGRTDGATLYVTLSPCAECAKLIIQAGIKRVVYADEYHSKSGLGLLKKAGVKVEKLKEDEE